MQRSAMVRYSRDHSAYWNDALSEMNIPPIHLPSSPGPPIYLGFPLFQARLQCQSFNLVNYT
jgi:hypothetical protein